ncbi:MAG TPA: two-component regulator propeller domain-containing protein [candidate division Zixibacteria bacterium]|nr:two-component regulator propeller domain-containing protein [candidate division Zixibacteria bacterium]
MKSRFLVLLFCVSLIASEADIRAITIGAQTLTYADFNNVEDITTSISHVYFATTEGIISYNKNTQTWEQPFTSATGIDNEDVRRVWVNTFDDKLYTQTGMGNYEYDNVFDRWLSVAEVPQLENNYVHIQPPPIMYAPPQYNYINNGTIVDPQGRSYQISDIIDDRTGNLWIGTWGLGAAVAGSSSDMIDLLPFGLLQNRVNAVYNDSGSLWVSGAALNNIRTGISVFNPDNNQFSYIESGLSPDFPSVDVNCIDGNGKAIYVGTTQGLLVFDPSSLQMTMTIDHTDGLPDDDVLSVKGIGDSIFVGTASGLMMFSNGADSSHLIHPRLFANTEIYDFEVTDSSLWIAAETGAYQLLLRTGRLQRFQDPTGVIFGRVYSIRRWGNNIWFSTDDGILRLNLNDGETQPFMSQVSGFTYRALAVNDRIAAVSSLNGLTLYFLSNIDHPNQREFTIADGLPSSRIYSLLMDGDYLWIGSDKGLTRFLWNDPNRVD